MYSDCEAGDGDDNDHLDPGLSLPQCTPLPPALLLQAVVPSLQLKQGLLHRYNLSVKNARMMQT